MPVLVLLLAVAAILVLAVLSFALAWEVLHPARITTAWALARGLPATPDELGVGHEEFDVTVEGRSLPVWMLRGAGEESDQLPKPDVIVVHAYGQSRITWLSFVHPLLNDAHAIVLYDRAGHGEMTETTARLGTGEASDLAAVIETLDPSREKVILAFGDAAAIALRYVSINLSSGRLPRVVLVDPIDSTRWPLDSVAGQHDIPNHPFRSLAAVWFSAFGVRAADATVDVGASRDSITLVIRTTTTELTDRVDTGLDMHEVWIEGESAHEKTDRLLEAIRGVLLVQQEAKTDAIRPSAQGRAR